MRRKRRRIEVSTFPFMAVLLCAMGSLILLLLVLDRQAKIVALARAKKAAEELATKDKAEVDNQLAAQNIENAQRRKELHDRLLLKKNRLAANLRRIRADSEKTKQAIDRRKGELAAWRNKLEIENGTLLELHKLLNQKKANLNQTTEAAWKTAKQYARLQLENRRLVDIRQKLRTANATAAQTYSVVPFRGKRGEDRKPIYLECTFGGVIFHPDQTRIEGFVFSPLVARKEIERRLKSRSSIAVAKKSKPYLFLLVRPIGLETFYDVQSALAGLEIDFGYELIDADWRLDFSNDRRSLPAPAVVATGPPSTLGVGKRTQGYKAGGGGPNNGGGNFKFASLPPFGKGAVQWKPSHSGTVKAPFGNGFAKPPTKTAGGIPAKPNRNAHSTTAPANIQRSPFRSGDSGKPNAGNATPDNERASPAKESGVVFGDGEMGISPMFGSRQHPRKQTPPLGRLIGNREWIIPIECNRDNARLPTERLTFSLAELSVVNLVEHPMTVAVRRMIERRQKSVRPGEPRYRPILRYEVTADGLRTYHIVFSLLAGLRLPAVRLNVQRVQPGLSQYYRD